MKLLHLAALALALIGLSPATAQGGQPIATLPAATSPLGGTEGFVATQAGKSVQISPAQIVAYTGTTIGFGTGTFLRLGSAIPLTNLHSLVVNGATNFFTTGFYTIGDGGGAQYYVNTGAALPGDQVSADGVRLSLSLSQQLTWEQLGAPTIGWIGTASISGTTLTVSATQSGAPAIGETVTAAGGIGAVSFGTRIVSGSGNVWIVNNAQTIGSTVMVGGDSYPYVADAITLGVHGMRIIGSHWFSQATVLQGAAVNWSGGNGYMGGGNNGYTTNFFYPTGYAGLVAVPANATVTPQGDVTLTGNAPFGGASGWSIDHVVFQMGLRNGVPPAVSVNHRPGVAIYTPGSLDNFQIYTADGDGLYIFGNGPGNLADKNKITNFTIAYSYDNNIETAGGDANTNFVSNGILANAGASNLYAHDFLGNHYDTLQSQGSGQILAIVRRSNNLYYSLTDGNIGHDPLSSAANWALWQASSGADTWSSGTTYRVGVSYRFDGPNNRSECVSCYSESDNPPALMTNQSSGQYLTNVFGGLLAAGINTTQTPVFSGYNGFVGANSSASTYSGYNNSGYGFQTTGGSTFTTGMFANNVNSSPGTATAGVFDAGVNGTVYSRFSGGVSPFSNSIGATVWSSGASGLTQMQVWDLNNAATAPYADNTYSLGLPSFRWSDVRAAKVNGVAVVSPTVVASLPTCNSGAKYETSFVTDATTPTYLGTLTGLGAVVAPVFCNGAAWVSY